MDLKDLRSVIEGPATLLDVQLKFQDDLVGDMLFEVQGQVGILPLLQFTLDQLFQQRLGHLLTQRAYREMGGVKGALSQRAEETYQGLPSEEHRQMARDVFLRLLVPGATGQDATRRRAARSEFEQADPVQTQQMQETLEAFISARLLTANQINGKTTIEVSHEALIREWKRLAEWLREAGDDILFQQSLSDDVTAWEQRKRPRDRLYRGAQLKEAQTWVRRNRPSELEVAFLRASVAQRIQSLVGLILVVLLLASSLGIAGWKVFFQPQPTLVTTLQDNNEVESLRWCINNAPSGSTIRFAQGIRGVIKLTGGDLVFAGGKRLSIVGPGANLMTISGGKTDAHIHVSKDATLTISDLGFKNSETSVDAFLFNEGTLTVTNSVIADNKTTAGVASFGGGIFNVGKLTVTNSTFSGNKASGSTAIGGGIGNADTGTLTVTNSTFSNNLASGDQQGIGGSIDNEGKVTVINSTLAYNWASGKQVGAGGGIFFYKGSFAIIRFSTIYGNTSSAGGGIFVDPAGSSQVMISSSIVAANSASDGPDISGALISDGYNLIENVAGAKGLNSTTDRQVNLANLKIDPTLGNNGGPAQTLVLLPGSPAIDVVPLQACSITIIDASGHAVMITTDQRGEPRPDGPENTYDIGAYESSY